MFSVVFNAARERDARSNSISAGSMQSAVFNTGIENECVKRWSSVSGCRLHPFARTNLNTFTGQRVFLQFWFKSDQTWRCQKSQSISVPGLQL